MLDWFAEQLRNTGMNDAWISTASFALAFVSVLVLSWVANVVARRLILRLVTRLVHSTSGQWDDRLLEAGFFSRVAHFAPALVVYLAANLFGEAQAWIQRLVLVYLIFLTIRVLDSLISASQRIYQASELSRERPIRGYLQLARLIIVLVGGIFVISTLLQKEPWGLLTGLGAMSAVLLLVFRDSILGFVASVQLASNNMVRPGDWIEMPQFKADGDVIEVGLHTVKVQNWDKTITTIPTYRMVTEAFKNWRGMEESQGRRIKRSILIDMNSIKFCDQALLDRFGKFALIRDYLRLKREEVAAFNRERGYDTGEMINGRSLTNIGTFRAYVEAYLQNHHKINHKMTFLVRQLAPTDRGLPLEIYVFSNDKAWANYEAIQADIFDHLLAVVPEFELRIYQSPSGGDFAQVFERMTPGH